MSDKYYASSAATSTSAGAKGNGHGADAADIEGAGVPAVFPAADTVSGPPVAKLLPEPPGAEKPEIVIEQDTDPRLALEQLISYVPAKSYARARRVMEKLATDKNVKITQSGRVILNGKEIEARNGVEMLRHFISPRIRSSRNPKQQVFDNTLIGAGYGAPGVRRSAKKLKQSTKPANPKWFFVGW